MGRNESAEARRRHYLPPGHPSVPEILLDPDRVARVRDRIVNALVPSLDRTMEHDEEAATVVYADLRMMEGAMSRLQADLGPEVDPLMRSNLQAVELALREVRLRLREALKQRKVEGQRRGEP